MRIDESTLKRGRIRQKHMEMILSSLSPHPRPKLKYETYTLDSKSASYVLSIAGHRYDDVTEKSVIDLGCGIGVLAIGAALIGAKYTVGVDIDRDSIQVAKENASKLGVDVNYVAGDIEAIHHSFDTALMNPPFGSWSRGADVKFLKKALDISTITYSLHKRTPTNRDFLKNQISSFGKIVDRIFELEISLPRTFTFHKKKKYLVEVDLYRIKSLKGR
jgi:putative methylase